MPRPRIFEQPYQISITLERAEAESAHQEARREGKDFSAFIRGLIVRELERRGSKKPAADATANR